MNILRTDVEDVKFVVNYDYPNSSEEYIHRIGRTGRSNKSGTAYSFFTNQNASKAGDLVNVLKEANQTVNPLLMDMMKRGNTSSRSKYNQRNNGRQMNGNDRNIRSQPHAQQMRTTNGSYQSSRPFNGNNQLQQKSSFQSRSMPMNYQTKNDQFYEMSSSVALNQTRNEASKFIGYNQKSSSVSAPFNLYGQQQMQTSYQSMVSGYNVPPPQVYTYPPPVLPVKN